MVVRENPVTDAIRRREAAALAGHTGDEAAARAALTDADPRVRATALRALGRLGSLTAADLGPALRADDPGLRRRAVEEARAFPDVDVVPLLADPDTLVVEAACWALGEREEDHRATVAALAHVATAHEEPLCREAAVAALGAIGSTDGLDAILAATSDKPAVRRRAVIALAPFEGPAVDAALERALSDRDWQVRQAAEDLLAAGESPAASAGESAADSGERSD